MSEEIRNERKEGDETKAPASGHHDTEPSEDIVPHSAKALSDYHDGLKDLTAAAEKHHGEFIQEMKKHHGALEHPAIKKAFGKYLERHQKALDGMTAEHKAMCKDMEEDFEKHHPGLEPLSSEAEEEEEEEAEKKPAAKPEEKKPAEGKAVVPEVKAAPASPSPAVLPQTPASGDDLDEDEARLVLKVIGQLKEEGQALRKDFRKAVGQAV